MRRTQLRRQTEYVERPTPTPISSDLPVGRSTGSPSPLTEPPPRRWSWLRVASAILVVLSLMSGLVYLAGPLFALVLVIGVGAALVAWGYWILDNVYDP